MGMRFRATLVLGGKTATGIPVPDEVVDSLGAGRRPPVRVTIGRHTYRSTITEMGGVYMVGVSAENRASAGVAAGDEVDVDIVLDTEPRVLTVPADFAEALDGNPGAKQFFEGLSFSRRQRFVVQIEAAKTQETRDRRIAKSVDDLRLGKG
jgi:hypothetical protein